VTLPLAFGCTIKLWVSNKSFSNTVPKISPAPKREPTFTPLSGLNSHNFVKFNGGTSTPLGTYTEFDFSAILFNGLCIPSKISDSMPGAKDTERGYLVLLTGSPTVRPDVSS